ncbi:uncharacterized protein LOC106671354 [Cimex lectularius]|uniref:Hemolymph juvenile hormone binding protein n=1 Tax=Cimex lectularius TaxID=79782 RepID=A0A8I6S662_CIMLE|nr:uncharacterized protein LOC106671354 [Cimex lectularius]
MLLTISFILLCPIWGTFAAEDEFLPAEDQRLSARIREVIVHYRKRGTVVLPASDIPDPLPVPSMSKYVGTTPILFTNLMVNGLKNVTIDHINTNIDKMQIYVAVYVNRLVITGNYSANYWFTRVGGEFNATLLEVDASSTAEFAFRDTGEVYTTDSNLDVSFTEAIVDFNSPGLVGTLLKRIMSSSASILLEGVKPFILQQINEKVLSDINNRTKPFRESLSLNRSSTLVEQAILEGRRYVKTKGFNPYHVRDYKLKYNPFTIDISNFVLEGLSDFHKIGNVTLFMEKGTIHLGIRLATLDLKGRCRWKINFHKNLSKTGTTNFTVDHFQVRAFVRQSIDVSEHPVLQNLDLNVGKVRVDMEGTGVDMIISLFVRTLPDIIRHIIVDAIEVPVQVKIQQLLNKIDMDEAVETGLEQLDNIGL